MFTNVYRVYLNKKNGGAILELNEILSELLQCNVADVYQKLEELINDINPKKTLREYGVKKEDLDKLTDCVMEKQARSMSNNYVELTRGDVYEIYMSTF